MLELLKKRIKNEKGLSLVELLAVIVILAIVAAIAIPAIGNIIENSRYNAVKSDAINVLNASNLYFTENPDETEVTVPELITEKYLDTPGKIENEEDSKVDKFIAGTIPSGGTVKDSDRQNALTTKAITFSGEKKIKFTGATVSGINANDKKGSKITDTEEIIK